MTPEETVALKAQVYDLLLEKAQLVAKATEVVAPYNKRIAEINASVAEMEHRLMNTKSQTPAAVTED